MAHKEPVHLEFHVTCDFGKENKRKTIAKLDLGESGRLCCMSLEGSKDLYWFMENGRGFVYADVHVEWQRADGSLTSEVVRYMEFNCDVKEQKSGRLISFPGDSSKHASSSKVRLTASVFAYQKQCAPLSVNEEFSIAKTRQATWNLFLEEKLGDFTIQDEKGTWEFKINGFLMASLDSGFIQTMLSSSRFQETLSKKLTLSGYGLPEVVAVFRVLLFMPTYRLHLNDRTPPSEYTVNSVANWLEGGISLGQLASAMRLAHFLQAPYALTALSTELTSHLSHETALLMLGLSKELGIPRLRMKVYDRVSTDSDLMIQVLNGIPMGAVDKPKRKAEGSACEPNKRHKH